LIREDIDIITIDDNDGSSSNDDDGSSSNDDDCSSSNDDENTGHDEEDVVNVISDSASDFGVEEMATCSGPGKSTSKTGSGNLSSGTDDVQADDGRRAGSSSDDSESDTETLGSKISKKSEVSPSCVTQPRAAEVCVTSSEGEGDASEPTPSEKARKAKPAKKVPKKSPKRKKSLMHDSDVGKKKTKKPKAPSSDKGRERGAAEKVSKKSGKDVSGSSGKAAAPKPADPAGKSYKDFSPIMDGYGDLLEGLNPDDPNSEVDKVVRFILDKNILVRHVNVVLSRFAISRSSAFYEAAKDMKELKIGRFTPGIFGENESLLKNWDELVRTVPISDPDKLIQDFLSLSSTNAKCPKKRKRNVLGCFLGKELKNVRHGADIFQHFSRLLSSQTGKFTKAEDKQILEEVIKFGPCLETWKRLNVHLKRSKPYTIKKRYIHLTSEKNLLRGRWTISEDEVFLETVFGGGCKDTGVDKVKSVGKADLQMVAEKLNRQLKSAEYHWWRLLLPILLSYHEGTLHKPWRTTFLKYLIEKQVVHPKDIDFKEAIGLIPNHTVLSLSTALQIFKFYEKDKPLYQLIQERLPTYQDPQETPKMQNYREKIVAIYSKVIEQNRVSL
jgi:hypothetical protein